MVVLEHHDVWAIVNHLGLRSPAPRRFPTPLACRPRCAGIGTRHHFALPPRHHRLNASIFGAALDFNFLGNRIGLGTVRSRLYA